MRRDPKEYESIGILHQMHKRNQEQADKKPHPYKKKADPKPGDEDYVEDVI